MIYIDTNILIYLLEGHAHYGNQVAAVLDELTKQGHTLATSVITVTEFLAGTSSSRLETLQQVPRLDFVILDETIAEQAAVLRRKHPSLQIGDAIHIATALRGQATLFFTNDRPLAQVTAEYVQTKTLG